VYTLEPNASALMKDPVPATETSINPSPLLPNHRIRVPLQPTVYRNKFLTPETPILYQSLSTTGERFYSDELFSEESTPYDHTSLKSEGYPNSLTSVTVNISNSPSVQEERPGEIDLQSVGEGDGGHHVKVSSGTVRNALTRVDNEEFQRSDVSPLTPPSSQIDRPMVTGWN
jgi:hypothetical protein